MKNCSFQPQMSSSKHSYRDDPLMSGRNESNTDDCDDAKKSDLTVQRLYYKETMRLKERRKQERLRHEREEKEKIDATCTFAPTLTSKSDR